MEFETDGAAAVTLPSALLGLKLDEGTLDPLGSADGAVDVLGTLDTLGSTDEALDMLGTFDTDGTAASTPPLGLKLDDRMINELGSADRVRDAEGTLLALGIDVFVGATLSPSPCVGT